MATHTVSARFALRPVVDTQLTDGAWWPENRTLSDQIGRLIATWPSEAGRIVRVLYSSSDWDDHPDSVPVPGGRVTTGALSHGDTHQVTLCLPGGVRRSITVIPPDTPPLDAEKILDGVVGRHHASRTALADQPVKDDEEGHLRSWQPGGVSTLPSDEPRAQTINYRGPPVLVGALAHLLREEGIEFTQPRDDRTGVAPVVEIILSVTAGASVSNRTLDARIDAAVARFEKRFGEDAASIYVGDGNDPR